MDHRRKLWNNIMEDLGPPEGCIVPWCRLVLAHVADVVKYPEKETEEFNTAVWRINAVHEYQVKVVYDVNGNCKLEAL